MPRRLLALCVASAALAALLAAPAHAAPGGDAPEVDGELVGCGTDTPEFTVNLVGRKGGFWFNNAIYHPDSLLASVLPVPSALEYTLGATLAPGDYDVSTISVDDHTGDPFRLLFGIVDRSPIESYGLAFDLGGAGEVIAPNRVPDLPDDDNWYADVPLDTEVPLSWSIGPDNPLFPQRDPVTPPEVLDRLPGFSLGTVTIATPQTSVWAAHIGELDGVEPVDAGSIVPYFATFTCTDVDDCDDEYGDNILLTVDPSTPALAGDTVTLAGTGYRPGDTVALTIERRGGPPGSQTPIPLDPPTAQVGDFGEADAGTFEVDVTLPATLEPGRHTIRAVSVECPDDRGSVDLTIRSPGGGQDPTVVEGTQTGTGVSPAANVLGSTQSAASTLATTGSDRTLSMAGLAVGLLALGGVFLMTGDRRRRVRAVDPDPGRRTG